MLTVMETICSMETRFIGFVYSIHSNRSIVRDVLVNFLKAISWLSSHISQHFSCRQSIQIRRIRQHVYVYSNKVDFS